MHNLVKKFYFLLSILIFTIPLLSPNIQACKDIIACGNTTQGEYNLLMKVRDPSRPGLQVLCIIPEDYEYNYHHPWNGKVMNFKNEHKYIGVCSEGDTIPEIVKAGMTLTDAGLAFGDSDSGSRWINPTKYAWDDFDWIRYACEKANTEEEAVDLLTKDAVDKLHATGVSENLFIIGPEKGYVVEADAYRYNVKEIENDVAVMHNYPKELWKTQRIKTFPISRSFDTEIEKTVRNRQVIRLGSLYGIRVVEIGNDYISVVPVGPIYVLKTNNLGIVNKIKIGEMKTVADFSIKLLEINENKAKIYLTNVFKAWEDQIMEYIEPRKGSITVKDMMNWSRLNKEDLNDLRSVCQKSVKYEAVTIYKVPRLNYDILSCGWFSANHVCSSIYIPFHICNDKVYQTYEKGDAAQLSLDLMKIYEGDILETNFSRTEDVFLYENKYIEEIAFKLHSDREDISNFITISDNSMQKQAYLTENIWYESSDKSVDTIKIISKIWKNNYYDSLVSIEKALDELKDKPNTENIRDKIIDIALDICKTRITLVKTTGYNINYIDSQFEQARELITKKYYKDGFDFLKNSYYNSNLILEENSIQINNKEKNNQNNKQQIILLFVIIIIFVLLIIVLIFNKIKK